MRSVNAPALEPALAISIIVVWSPRHSRVFAHFRVAETTYVADQENHPVKSPASDKDAILADRLAIRLCRVWITVWGGLGRWFLTWTQAVKPARRW